MSSFRSLVKSKGFTVDEIYDLLKHGAMALCQPSYSAVAKWVAGERIASGDHLLALLEFTQTHSQNGIKKRQSKPSVKTKKKK